MTERVSAWQDPWNTLLHKANRLEIELAASENAREALERQRDELLAALEASLATRRYNATSKMHEDAWDLAVAAIAKANAA